jgi:hypothetical protein
VATAGLEVLENAICASQQRFAIAGLGYGVSAIARYLFRLVVNIVFACLDTTWEMILGSIGAAVGASVGFVLINLTVVGDRFAEWIAPQMLQVLPDIQITAWREILLFTSAGLGTAWGLTLAGGFGQQRRPIIAGVTATLGYSISWFIWQAAISTASPPRLLGLITAIAVFPLVLGLGLPSHYLVHALVGAAGTGLIFGTLVLLNILPLELLINIFSRSQASWPNFIESIAFFGLLGITLGFWLGVSYYLLVPILRWLGWR